MTDLTEIDGIGPSYADDLVDGGFDSAEDVAEADPSEVDAVLAADGSEVVSKARDVTDDPVDDVDDDPAKDERYEIDPGLSQNQVGFLLRSLVDQLARAERSNDMERKEAVYDAIDQVLVGEPYQFTLQQLSLAYTGVNQLENEYRSTRGLSSFVGEINELKGVLQEHRSRNWPEN